ncbi:MAG: putative calcium binding hemolysin protein [Rhizobium sp.]|nr:putative calcium binding hemolysin protein [Rhizobium sp.]
MTSATIRDEDGHVLITIKDVDLSAVQVYKDVVKYGVSALQWTFAAGDDRVTGSIKADSLQGDYGDDVIFGKGGSDYLSGYHGNDTLIGGGGSDNFLFDKLYDIDRITDFDDLGKDQDQIWLKQAMWDRMDKHREGDDVVLDFGGGDELIIEHAKIANITREDFQLFS